MFQDMSSKQQKIQTSDSLTPFDIAVVYFKESINPPGLRSKRKSTSSKFPRPIVGSDVGFGTTPLFNQALSWLWALERSVKIWFWGYWRSIKDVIQLSNDLFTWCPKEERQLQIIQIWISSLSLKSSPIFWKREMTTITLAADKQWYLVLMCMISQVLEAKQIYANIVIFAKYLTLISWDRLPC